MPLEKCSQLPPGGSLLPPVARCCQKNTVTSTKHTKKGSVCSPQSSLLADTHTRARAHTHGAGENWDVTNQTGPWQSTSCPAIMSSRRGRLSQGGNYDVVNNTLICQDKVCLEVFFFKRRSGGGRVKNCYAECEIIGCRMRRGRQNEREAVEASSSITHQYSPIITN